jgi:CheY-like chemotaxis protein
VTAAVPIIAVSADGDVERDARAVGCEAFLLKPVRQFDLIGHIRRLLTEVGEREGAQVLQATEAPRQ